MLSAGTLVSASCHIPFVQLIVMLSSGASSSASHLNSTTHMASLLCFCPPLHLPLITSLSFLGLCLLLCLCLSLCSSPSVDCHVVFHQCLGLPSSYGHYSSFTLVADCYVINATLSPLDSNMRMFYWLALWQFLPQCLYCQQHFCCRCSGRQHTSPLTLRALTSQMFRLWTSEPVVTSARDDNHSWHCCHCATVIIIIVFVPAVLLPCCHHHCCLCLPWLWMPLHRVMPAAMTVLQWDRGDPGNGK